MFKILHVKKILYYLFAFYVLLILFVNMSTLPKYPLFHVVETILTFINTFVILVFLFFFIFYFNKILFFININATIKNINQWLYKKELFILYAKFIIIGFSFYLIKLGLLFGLEGFNPLITVNLALIVISSFTTFIFLITCATIISYKYHQKKDHEFCMFLYILMSSFSNDEFEEFLKLNSYDFISDSIDQKIVLFILKTNKVFKNEINFKRNSLITQQKKSFFPPIY